MRNVNKTIISAADITGSPASSSVDSNQLFSCSAQVVAAGSSPVGTVKLQFSNDLTIAGNLPMDFTPTNWSDIPNASVSVTDVGVFAIAKTDLCYRWIRAKYTATSGTGTVTVNFFAQSV